MIPKKIQPYLKIKFQKNDGDNELIGGLLTCCDNHDFEIFVVGKIKYDFFSKTYLFPENNRIIVEAHCKKCGKAIQVFDSNCDGYEHRLREKVQHACVPTKIIHCKKCRCMTFSINIKYEYPNDMDFEESGIICHDNAFTWIWIMLECSKCGAKYRKFVDFETA